MKLIVPKSLKFYASLIIIIINIIINILLLNIFTSSYYVWPSRSPITNNPTTDQNRVTKNINKNNCNIGL